MPVAWRHRHAALAIRTGPRGAASCASSTAGSSPTACADVPLARLLGCPGPAGGRALLARPTPSSTRACTRGWAPRRPTATGSASAGTARRPDAGRVPRRRARLERREPARPRGTRHARRCSSPTSAPRPARPSSRPTATRSATTAGCGCTTGSINDFRAVKRDLVLDVDPLALPVDRGADGLRGAVLPRAHPRARATTRPPRWRARSGSSRPPGAGAASSTRSRGRSRRPTASGCGCSATRARAGRARST